MCMFVRTIMKADDPFFVFGNMLILISIPIFSSFRRAVLHYCNMRSEFKKTKQFENYTRKKKHPINP